MTAPNLEERLAAAAFVILTDGFEHTQQARNWAVRFLRSVTKGQGTAFQRRQFARGRAFVAGRVQ